MIDKISMAKAQSWPTYLATIAYATLLILSGVVSYFPEYLIRQTKMTNMVDSRIMGLLAVATLVYLFCIIGPYIWDDSQNNINIGFFGYKAGTETSGSSVTYSTSYGSGSSNFALSRQAFVGIMITMNVSAAVILGLTFFGTYPEQFEKIKPFLGENSKYYARFIAICGILFNVVHIAILVSKADLNGQTVGPEDPYLDGKLTLVYLFVLIMNFSSCYILTNTFFNQIHTVAADVGKIAILLWILVLTVVLLALFWGNNLVLNGSIPYTIFFVGIGVCTVAGLWISWKLMAMNTEGAPVSSLSKTILVLVVASGLVPLIIGLISLIKKEDLAFGISFFGTIFFLSLCGQIVRAIEDVRNGMLIVDEAGVENLRTKTITKPPLRPRARA